MIFKNDLLGKLRVCKVKNTPWFVAADVAKMLDYSRVKNFLQHVQSIDQQIVTNAKCDIGFLENKMVLISEQGLYQALDKMTGVRAQTATMLKKWVQLGILPSLKPQEVKEEACKKENEVINMNDMQIFNNDDFGTLRTVEDDGKVLFVASDVAKMLGYANPNKAVGDHCKGVTKRYTLTNGGKQALNVITEGDVYRLVAHSKLPKAEQFESWVFDEVLPTIRKTGGYQKPMSQLEIMQCSINRLVEQEREIARIKLTQQEQAESLQSVSKRIDTLNGVCIDGTKRQQLVTLVNSYASKAGYAFAKAWNDFRDAYNKAFHTNIGLLRKNYMNKNNITKKPSIPEFLEIQGLLDDGIRIADKLLATVK